MRKTEARPIVKWAGGKRQLLPQLSRNCPSSFVTYYEPFVGGGALFFHLYSKGLIKRAILADANADLIELYLVVQNHVEELIEELKTGKYVNEKDVYYQIRAEEPDEPILRAARFIYLNKTCYNGLYRVNAQGKFNVPFGKYKNPQILDEQNLRAASQALKLAELRVGDFERTVRDARRGDFVYFDPPYVPLSETADFTTYTKDGFDLEEQRRLSRVFRELDDRGCYVLESNSATQLVNELYSGYYILEVYASRAISSDASTRGKIPEYLIANYELSDIVQSTMDDF